MQLVLTDTEASLLRDLLQDLLPDLRREAARTEQKELRHRLILRIECAEQLLAQLGEVAV